MSKGLPPYTNLPPDYNLSEQVDAAMATAPTAPDAMLPPYPYNVMTSQPGPVGPPTQHTVVINAAAAAHNTQVGPSAMRMTCPNCSAQIKSKIKHVATSHTHCMAICLCLFCCWPCVCLPYCMDSCQNANHYCPNCNAFIGTYQS